MNEPSPEPIRVVPLEYAFTDQQEAAARKQFRDGMFLVAAALLVGVFAEAFNYMGGFGIARRSASLVIALLGVSLMASGGWLVLRTSAAGKRRRSMLPIAICLFVLAAGIPLTKPFVKLFLQRMQVNWAAPSQALQQAPKLLWSLGCLWVFLHIWRVLGTWNFRQYRRLILATALLACLAWLATAVLQQTDIFLDTLGGPPNATLQKLQMFERFARALAGAAAVSLAACLAGTSMAMRGRF